MIGHHLPGRPLIAKGVCSSRGDGLYILSPRALFTDSSIGLFVLPKRIDSLYQLAEGTTPVTADGQPVGFVYDQKRGNPVIGSAETLLTTTATKASDGTSTTSLLATDGIVGKHVQVSFTVSGVVGSFSVKSSATGGTTVAVTADGTYTLLVQAGATGGFIQIEGLTNSRYSVTSIVIRPVSGANPRMTTLAARPIYRTSPARFEFDKVDDALSVYLPAIANGTLMIAGVNGTWLEEGFSHAGGTLSIGPATITGLAASNVTTSTLLAIVGDIVGVFIIDRAITALEQSNLVSFFKSVGSAGLITYGSDIVTNGTFTSDLSGWEILNASTTWQAGRAKLANTGYPAGQSINRFRQQIPTTAGKLYFATAQFENTSLVSFLYLQARVYGAIGTVGTLLAQNNRLTNFASGGKTGIAFEATGTDQISVLVDTTITGTLFAHVDNITCREIIMP